MSRRVAYFDSPSYRLLETGFWARLNEFGTVDGVSAEHDNANLLD